jgi:hypothetical protein
MEPKTKLRKFELRDRPPHPSAIYANLHVIVDDQVKDDELIDGRQIYYGLAKAVSFVLDSIRNSNNKEVQIYVSTDTLYNILHRLLEFGWSYKELVYIKDAGWISNGFNEPVTQEKNQYYPIPCKHCQGTTYHHANVTQGKCFHCFGSGCERKNG